MAEKKILYQDTAIDDGLFTVNFTSEVEWCPTVSNLKSKFVFFFFSHILQGSARWYANGTLCSMRGISPLCIRPYTLKGQPRHRELKTSNGPPLLAGTSEIFEIFHISFNGWNEKASSMRSRNYFIAQECCLSTMKQWLHQVHCRRWYAAWLPRLGESANDPYISLIQVDWGKQTDFLSLLSNKNRYYRHAFLSTAPFLGYRDSKCFN